MSYLARSSPESHAQHPRLATMSAALVPPATCAAHADSQRSAALANQAIEAEVDAAARAAECAYLHRQWSNAPRRIPEVIAFAP